MKNSKHLTHRFRTILRLTIVLAGLIVISFPIFAQNQSEAAEVSDQELESFVAVVEELQEVQRDLAAQSQESVESSEMGVERFQELFQARQSGTEPATAATDAENEEFDQLVAEIREIQQEFNDVMVQAVQDEGLAVERFNEIAQAIRQDQSLQQRIQEIAGGGNS